MNFDKVLKLKQPELKTHLRKELKSIGYAPVEADGYLYAEGTVPVLLIAHMDTVHTKPVSAICKSSDGIWMAPEGIGGDDRCGIYSILQIVRHYNCHVLFTEDEEHGCIGAGKFCKSDIAPDIRFIIELDRKGKDDCVFYSCDNPDFTKFIEGFGFKTAFGSCSDISSIAPHLNRAAVNLSCGYYNPHTEHEYIVVDHMWETIRRVEQILSSELDTTYIFIRKVYTYSGSGYSSGSRHYGYGWYDDDDDTPINKASSAMSTGYVKRYAQLGKKYRCTDEEVQDIYWLYGVEDQYFIRYDKTASGIDIDMTSVDDYGVDDYGRIWFWDPNSGDIYIDRFAEVYDMEGFRVWGYSLYTKLRSAGYSSIYTLRIQTDEFKADYDTTFVADSDTPLLTDGSEKGSETDDKKEETVSDR